MDLSNLRPVLLISLLFVGYLIWVEWQKDYGPQPAASSAADSSLSQPQATTGGDLPTVEEIAP